MTFDPNDVNPPLLYPELEVNYENDLNTEDYTCDMCNNTAIKEVEVNENRYGSKYYGLYCKSHYDSLESDLIERIEVANEPDNFEEED